MCSSGYTGQNCESDYIPCNPSPCENGGSCHQISEHDYKCICAEGEYHYTVPTILACDYRHHQIGTAVDFASPVLPGNVKLFFLSARTILLLARRVFVTLLLVPT